MCKRAILYDMCTVYSDSPLHLLIDLIIILKEILYYNSKINCVDNYLFKALRINLVKAKPYCNDDSNGNNFL